MAAQFLPSPWLWEKEQRLVLTRTHDLTARFYTYSTAVRVTVYELKKALTAICCQQRQPLPLLCEVVIVGTGGLVAEARPRVKGR